MGNKITGLPPVSVISLVLACICAACSSSDRTPSGENTGGTSSSTGGGNGTTTGGTDGSGATGGISGVGGSSGTSGGGAGGSSSGGVGGTGSGGAPPGDCDPNDNILTTGNTVWDRFDCLIIELAEQYDHPDPRVLKSMTMQESSYNVLAISQDSPCGIEAGWTDAESKSFGLLQVTPACGEGDAALLANGHPNLTEDMNSELWATSIFNPELNLKEGVDAIASSLSRLKQKYPSCTNEEYALMAAGAYNSGDSAVLGCNSYSDRARNYVNAVLGRYAVFAERGAWPTNVYPERL